MYCVSTLHKHSLWLLDRDCVLKALYRFKWCDVHSYTGTCHVQRIHSPNTRTKNRNKRETNIFEFEYSTFNFISGRYIMSCANQLAPATEHSHYTNISYLFVTTKKNKNFFYFVSHSRRISSSSSSSVCDFSQTHQFIFGKMHVDESIEGAQCINEK